MNKELFLALENGDVAKIQSLHKQKSSVLLELTFQEDTPLHIAAREGHLRIVDWILKEKPSFTKIRNKDWNVPLHEAAKCGNLELVSILLQHRRKSALYENIFKETALTIASKYGHLETVKFLCDAMQFSDSSVTERSVREAAYRGYQDIVKAIVDQPTKPHILLRNPLHRFIQNTRDVGKVIYDLFSDDIVRTTETPKLNAAVHGGHLEAVRAVLNSFSRHYKDLMTEKDKFGMCAIHVAAMIGRWDIINEFMSRWPDSADIRSSDHKSVLHFAVKYDKFEVVQNLLLNKSPQRAAELVSRDHDRFHNTALHMAAIDGVDPQLVEYLISFPGVDMDALNDEDMTALDIASAAAKDNPNCAKIVQKLESAGAIRANPIQKSITTFDERNDSKKEGDGNIVDIHMVVASLIATVTFAAIFQIPGGIEDDKQSILYGTAKMALRRLFRFFIFSDTAAFTTSLTVVIAWIIRQLFGDAYFGKKSTLTNMSAVTLLVSIMWTIAAFVSAAIIVIIPPHPEKLKIKDSEAFFKYESLWKIEIICGIIAPMAIGIMFLFAFFQYLYGKLSFRLVLIYIYFHFVGVTAIIILGTFIVKWENSFVGTGSSR